MESISTGRPRKAFPVLANFSVFCTDQNNTTGTAAVQIRPATCPKLSMSKGRIKRASGMTSQRVLVSVWFFFSTLFAQAREIPAVRNPK